MRRSISKDEIKPTSVAIEKAHNLCSENKGSHELVADVGTLFQCLKYVNPHVSARFCAPRDIRILWDIHNVWERNNTF